MKLQQLRYLVEVAKHDLHVSDAADALHTSQPGISRQIRLLESELGVQIFIRNGKRIVATTQPGKEVIRVAERILAESQNLKRISDDYARIAQGSLSIATTHTQARYMLPKIIPEFSRLFPDVRLSLKQGSPSQIVAMVEAGEADLGIATEGVEYAHDLVMLPCYQWNRSVITPPAHPLLKQSSITLADIAQYPIITYDFAFTGGSKITQAFTRTKLNPNIVLSAIDTDVIKTYVKLNLGIGLIASMAYEEEADTPLQAINVAHLFEPSTTWIGVRKGTYLRDFAYTFIELFAPQLKKAHIQSQIASV